MTGRRVHKSAEAHKRTADTAAVSRRIWLFPDNIDYIGRRRLAGTRELLLIITHRYTVSDLMIEAQSFAGRK